MSPGSTWSAWTPICPCTLDQFAALTELAAQRDINTVVEPVPGLTIGDVGCALAAKDYVGRGEFRLLIDTMHLVRSGSGATELAAIDADQIGYAELNDTTLRPRIDNYLEEAMFERMVPGEGELPLHDLLSALPATPCSKSKFPGGHWRWRG